MTFPISVQAENGVFVAWLVGAPNVRVVETTRKQALATLRAKLQEQVAQGELLAMEVEPLSVAASDS